MLRKTKVTSIYIMAAIITAILYGFIAYIIIYHRLAGGSVLLAYLYNIALIIIFLSLDKLIHAKLQSDKFVVTRRNYLFALWIHIENYISFKTTIYLFYIFILITSRISFLDPTLVSEDFRNFILSIEYGLILVIAFDKLTEHVFKDVKRVKIVDDKFKKYMDDRKKRP